MLLSIDIQLRISFGVVSIFLRSKEGKKEGRKEGKKEERKESERFATIRDRYSENVLRWAIKKSGVAGSWQLLGHLPIAGRRLGEARSAHWA